MKQKKAALKILSVLILMLQVPGSAFSADTLTAGLKAPAPEKAVQAQQTQGAEQSPDVIPIADAVMTQGPLTLPTGGIKPIKPTKLPPVIIKAGGNGKIYDSKKRVIEERTEGQKVRRFVYVMEDENPIAVCKAGGDLGSCANHLIENKKANETLEIVIPEGTFILSKETLLIFQKDDIVIRGAGENKTIVQLADSLAESRGSRADRYFFINIIDSDNVTIDGLTLDGKNLGAQRGIAVTGLGDRQVQNVAIRNTEFKNFIGYAVTVGSSYTDNFVKNYSVYLNTATNTPERFRLGQYFLSKKKQGQDLFLYPAGTVKNFTFENNTVYMNAGMSIGLVFETYAVKQVPDTVEIAPKNWFSIAQALAEKNSGAVIRGNTFIAQTNDIHAAMKISHVQDMLIEGNKIIADGFPKAFKGGAAINIAFNVLHSVIRKNEIRFPADHIYPQGGININSGFSMHDRYYGIGDKKLTTPSLDILIEGNIFYNARVRFSDFSLNEPAYTAFADHFEKHPPVDENIRLSGNSFFLNQVSKEESELVWQASQKETLSARCYARKSLQVMVISPAEMVTWIAGKKVKVIFSIGVILQNTASILPAQKQPSLRKSSQMLAARLILENLLKRGVMPEAVVEVKVSGSGTTPILTLKSGSRSFQYSVLSLPFPQKTQVQWIAGLTR